MLSLDGLEVRAVHVRGHTLGSMIYVVNGLCFTGDSLFHHADHVAEGPRLFSEEPDRIRGSLQDKLVPLGCERFADGHAGLTEGAGPKLAAFLARTDKSARRSNTASSVGWPPALHRG